MQNPFPMKHATDQMPSQNSSKIRMKEIVELTPQKKSPERILHSAKKGKTNIPSIKPKNDKTLAVTIEMYNNLKCAFNKIDDEMAHFAKRYQEEQKVIATEITDLIKKIITPIAEENKNLREDLQTAKKRIDELNTLILDLTTKNENKITENKILITNKIDEINNQVTNAMENHIVTTENRTNATLQKDNKKKQKEENTHTDTNQPPKHIEILASQQTPSTLSTTKANQTEKINTTPVSQNTNNSRNQNIVILMGSNKKFIDFRELLSNETEDGVQIVSIPCGNVRKAETLMNSPKIADTSKIIIHVGVSDVDNQYPESITDKLVSIAKKFQEKFKCKIYLSDITPQNDHFQGHVQALKQTLAYKTSKNNIQKVSHSNLSPNYLHDDRHLKRNRSAGEMTLGVELLCSNI